MSFDAVVKTISILVIVACVAYFYYLMFWISFIRLVKWMKRNKTGSK